MRRLVVTLGLLAVAVVNSCALIDGLLGPAMYGDDELCDEVRRIWAGCSVDLSTCGDVIACAREKRAECPEQWDRWVRCLQAEAPSCDDANAGESFPCAGPYRGYLACIGNGSQGEGEGMILGCLSDGEGCGNGVCDAQAGESPASCSSDCINICSWGEDGGVTTSFCTAFRSDSCPVCDCDGDFVCNNLSENHQSCPSDCSCDIDGECRPGEDVFGCWQDCHCNFDGRCESDEQDFTCPDCNPCDGPGCVAVLGGGCDPSGSGDRCMVPLVCDPSDSVCRQPCTDNAECPSNQCNGHLCL